MKHGNKMPFDKKKKEQKPNKKKPTKPKKKK